MAIGLSVIGCSHSEYQFDGQIQSKMEYSQSLDFSDFKSLPQFRQSLLFCALLNKTKGGFACRVHHQLLAPCEICMYNAVKHYDENFTGEEKEVTKGR